MNSFPSEIANKTKPDLQKSTMWVNIPLSNLFLDSTNEVIKKKPVISMKRTFLFHADLIKMFLMINEVGIRLIADIGVMY